MAETETENLNSPDPSSNTLLLGRKIKFVPLKKPYNGFSNDFHIETLNPSTSEPRPPGTSPAAPKKHDVSEFSEYGLDPELSFGITFRRIVSCFFIVSQT